MKVLTIFACYLVLAAGKAVDPAVELRKNAHFNSFKVQIEETII